MTYTVIITDDADNQLWYEDLDFPTAVEAVKEAWRDVFPNSEDIDWDKVDLQYNDNVESETDLVHRLRERARIRRQIPTRKSVQEGKPDRLADLLDEAANRLSILEHKHTTRTYDGYDEGDFAEWGYDLEHF